MDNDLWPDLDETLSRIAERSVAERAQLRRMSPQNALSLTLSAMGINSEDRQTVRTWYKRAWKKDGNESYIETGFDKFWSWLQEETTEHGRPCTIHATSLINIEDSLEPKWKAYYFFIRTWGTPPAGE